MGTTLGSIDDRFRPLVRIEQPGDRGGFLALLDTGFNGEIHCDTNTAVQLGVTPFGEPVRTQLAGGALQWALVGELEITWMERRRVVQVLIAMTDRPSPRFSDGEPVALIGGALLVPSLVLLDYEAMTVEIEAQG